MGFSINNGSPGPLMALMILFGVAVGVIVVIFLLSAIRGAHDDVVEDDEPDS